MDPIEIIYRTPELKAVFSKFLETNTSNNAPYHNLWHTLCMVRFCYEGAMEEGLSESDTTDLLIAALIHDYCHSEGKRDDKYNVRHAIYKGEELYEDTSYFEGIDGMIEFKHRIARIIKATQYPYVIPAEELDHQQSIIRDADLFQSFEKTWLTHTTIGIAKEANLDLKDFLLMEIDFVKKAEFNTNWGKETAKKKVPDLLSRLEMLKELLDVPVTYIERARMEEDKKKQEAFHEDKLRGLYIKYPVNTFEMEIEKIEAQGYEVSVSTDSAQVWKKTSKERLATDLIIDADFADTYNDNLVMMIDAFYNGG